MKESLIVFTRYPEPGKAKTRLIPALGAEGAANLQRQMTEYTLSQVRKLQASRQVAVAIYFAGDNQHLMQDWLGSDLVYQQQSEGDLGMRMRSAFQDALTNNMEKVIIIGTDCPSLSAEIIEQAFEQLTQHDLVLGPAKDGGYYLIGLRRLIPELFSDINWGTSEVFQQTVKIAEALDVSIASLTTLADIDRPEDLSVVQALGIGDRAS